MDIWVVLKFLYYKQYCNCHNALRRFYTNLHRYLVLENVFFLYVLTSVRNYQVF